MSGGRGCDRKGAGACPYASAAALIPSRALPITVARRGCHREEIRTMSLRVLIRLLRPARMEETDTHPTWSDDEWQTGLVADRLHVQRRTVREIHRRTRAS